MAPVFGTFAAFSTLLLCIALGAGFLHHSSHLLWGVGASIAAICCHSLVFAIFTGSGKDTRLLVEDWKLDPVFVKKAKAFKRDVFPPALYAIFWTLMVVLLGGIVSRFGTPWVRWTHALFAVGTLIYNVKIFLLETKAIAENARLIASVNQVAAKTTAGVAPEKDQFSGAPNEKVMDLDFETHVYAFARFLTFMGLNVWLVFIYVRIIMGMISVPTWPFVLLSALLFIAGSVLKARYRKYQPA